MVLILNSENEIRKKEWNTSNLNFLTVYWWWGWNCGSLFFVLSEHSALWIAFYSPLTPVNGWLCAGSTVYIYSVWYLLYRETSADSFSLSCQLYLSQMLMLKSIHLPFLDDKKNTPGIFHTGDKPVMLLKQKQWANNWNRWWASEWTHPWGIQLLETFERCFFCDEFIL